MDKMPVLLQHDNGCYRLILNRIDKHNALNPDMIDAIYEHLMIVKDDQLARMLVIESASDIFMVGGDIFFFAQLTSYDANKRVEIVKPMLDKAQMIIQLIITLNCPVIGVVKGIAAGYGLSLILACDYVIALDKANFHSSYIGIGLTPDGAQLYTLKNAIGLKKAKKMLLFNEPLGAKEAYKLGLIDQLYDESGKLDEKLNFMVLQSKQTPLCAFGAIKTQVNDIDEITKTLEDEKELFLTQIRSEEFSLRVNAFIEREKKKHK